VCPGKDRLGPYATREEAEHALDTVHRRNEEGDAADDDCPARPAASAGGREPGGAHRPGSSRSSRRPGKVWAARKRWRLTQDRPGNPGRPARPARAKRGLPAAAEARMAEIR